MSPWRDVVDWVGGYPYEFAKPEEIFDFYKNRGFALSRQRTFNGNGCDEFLFVRAGAPP
jgi:2-polyprenyl-6-hydroxyphenyl methylase/3-demethylubiquinone-9 3-methyltransferase